MNIRQAQIFLSTLCCFLLNCVNGSYDHYVNVYHYILSHWGESRTGLQPCGNIACNWQFSDHIKHLRDNFYFAEPKHDDKAVISLSLYNIHSLWEKTRGVQPAHCELKTAFTMTETEESKVRYGYLFDQSFKNFDGYSSTSPSAAVQRVYVEAFLNRSDFHPSKNFSSLIKAASYVASDCHRHDSANAGRDNVVHQIRAAGFRIDGLGRCMHSIGPEGVSLPRTKDTRYNLHMKRDTIGQFMFYMAFENSLEPGYVTEKPFDAMIAGTVPVYLGDAEQLRSLLPHPKAAIFIADYNGDYGKLVQYLNYLAQNETAYEEHRSWRHAFDFDANVKNKPLLKDSWFCRICQWTVLAAKNRTDTIAGKPAGTSPVHGLQHHRVHICANSTAGNAPQLAPSEWEGKAVRANGQRVVYLVQKGRLRPIPDMDTFAGLGLDLGKVIVIGDKEVDALTVGEPMPRIAG